MNVEMLPGKSFLLGFCTETFWSFTCTHKVCENCVACRYAGQSGEQGPEDRAARDSEEDNFDVQQHSPERSVDGLEASDEDALLHAFDVAMAHKDKLAAGVQDNRMGASEEEGLEDEDLEDDDA